MNYSMTITIRFGPRAPPENQYFSHFPFSGRWRLEAGGCGGRIIMTHILVEQPELIAWVVGFALLVGSVPYWGDLARCARRACALDSADARAKRA